MIKRDTKSSTDSSPSGGDSEPTPKSILEFAWQLQSDYDNNADLSVLRHRHLREWVIVLGVIATLLAILSDLAVGNAGGSQESTPLIVQVLRIMLVIVPISGSVILAMANRFQEGERWLALRTGAENILRVIYLYRTVLSKNPNRDQWLEERLAEIRRETVQKLSGNLALKIIPFKKAWHFNIEPLTDLKPDEYIKDRLEGEIKDYSEKIVHTQRVRTRLQVTILILGGIGSLLAALSNRADANHVGIWVAFSTAIAVAISSWLELRQLDWRVLRGMSSEEREKIYSSNTDKSGSTKSIDDPLETTVAIYSHIINELSIAREHWSSLNDPYNTSEFYELVLVVERVLWGKDFTLGQQVQQAIIDETVAPQQEPSIKGETSGSLQAAATGKDGQVQIELDLEKSNQALRVLPCAVVLMPSGRKPTTSGSRIDFDHVFSILIEPALKKAGFSVDRWTDRKPLDSVQALLLADIVLVDIGFDDADVFYNMGIRHSFRKHGIIHIHEAQARSTYGTFKIRSVEYHCNKYGRIDSAVKEDDIKALESAVNDVWLSDNKVVHSPIFENLSSLREPRLDMLRLPLAMGYWRESRAWRDSLRKAQRNKRAADLLLLTEELQNPLIREDAIGEIGQILRNSGKNDLALIMYNKGLEVNPHNSIFRREEAFNLNRTGRGDEAILRIESLLRDSLNDSETVAYLGRVYKEMWYDSWKGCTELRERIQAAIESYHWLLKAFESYLKGYRYDLNNAYPGINALTLGSLLVYLVDTSDDKKLVTPEVDWVRNILQELRGTLAFTLEPQVKNEQADYWTLISLAELRLMTTDDSQAINRAYHRALTASRRNPFYLRSSLEQLEMLRLLGIREDSVRGAMKVLQDELESSLNKAPGTEEEYTWSETETRSVYLFAGYMFNHAKKMDKQLPKEKEAELAAEFDSKLKELQAKGNPLAITAGLNGGSELLFVERCVAAHIPVQVYLPEAEAAYIDRFVRPAGEDLVERFIKMRNDENVEIFYQPDYVGLPKKDSDTYERNNRWATYSALEYGIDNVYLLVVWDGKNEPVQDLDSYLVQHMVKLVNDFGFRYWYDQIYPDRLSKQPKAAAETGNGKKAAGSLEEQQPEATPNPS